jgi:hypothetical protein
MEEESEPVHHPSEPNHDSDIEEYDISASSDDPVAPAFQKINIHHDPNYTRFRGTLEERKAMEEEWIQFKDEQWKHIANRLIGFHINEDTDEEKIIQVFQMMHNFFCIRCENNQQLLMRIEAISPSINVLKDRKFAFINLFTQLVKQMAERKMIGDPKFKNNVTPLMKELKHDLNEISCAMKSIFDTIIDMELFKNTQDLGMRSSLYEMNPESMLKDFTEITKNQKPHQIMCMYYWRKMWKEGLCIEVNEQVDVGVLYKPKYNARGQFVCAYEKYCTVSEYVFTSLTPIMLNIHWYTLLTEQPGTTSNCIKMLTNIHSEFLPRLNRNRNLHAWQNGVYDVTDDTFYFFDRLPNYHHIRELKFKTSNTVAINYHDQIFHLQEMEAEVAEKQKRFHHKIKTDFYDNPENKDQELPPLPDMPQKLKILSIDLKLDEILTSQKFTPTEILYIYGLMGRMMHEVNSLDQWSLVIFFLGLAGTGKSTLLKLVASLYEMKDVGFLSNNMQDTFGLETLIDKLIALAMDVDDRFKLNQATFLSMACGEYVSVAIKHKPSKDIIWKSHLALAGNKFPSWQDQGGNIQRRLFTIEFINLILNYNTALFDQCLKEKDRMMKVWNMCYLYLAKLYKDKALKPHCPAKFTASEKRALAELNPLISFIENCCQIDNDMTQKTSITDYNIFLAIFRNYCRQNSIQPPKVNTTFLTGALSKWQIEIIDPNQCAPEKAQGQISKFLLGLSIREHVLQQNSRFL